MFIRLIVLIRNIKNLLIINCIKKIWPLFIFSCVYYNTFYNAEVNYEKAEKIIQETAPSKGDNDKIPTQAKKLLGKAIENSNIVINKHPNSKYVDDAYFIIGKASFLRKEFFNAEKYLKKLNEYDPESEYCDESKIWLAYTYLKMDSLDVAKFKLNELKNLKDKKYKYLINNIFAEIAIQEDQPFDAYNYYNKSLVSTNDKSQKTSIYLKLLDISEKYEHLDSSIVYLSQLFEYGTDAAMKKQIKLDWIKYNRKARNFNDLLVQIDKMLSQQEYSNIYIKLELEKAKIYLDQEDLESAKIFFTELSDKYSRKSESAESLYHLGRIALMENFDLELALEYFERSKKDRKTSLYGKRSRDMINRINDYKNLLNELEIILTVEEVVDEPEDTSGVSKAFMPKPKQKESTPDSILFVISEKLLFDFDQLNNAKDNYKRLIDEYPNSKFRPQSLYVLNYYFPEEEWQDILNDEYPNSKFNLNNEDNKNLELNSNPDLEKDEIWKVCEVSYKLCAKNFLDFYNQNKDLDALYFYAFINDNYLSETNKAIEYYKQYLNSEPDLRYNSQTTTRLNEIEDSIYSMIDWTSQKINYYNSVEGLRNGKELDSVLVDIDKCIEGSFSNFKSSGQLIKSKLNKLISINKQIISYDSFSIDSLTNNKDLILDSLYFINGKIYQLDFSIYDSASYYYTKIIDTFPNSKFRYESIVALDDMGLDNDYWGKIIDNQYPDTTFISDSSYKTLDIIEEIYEESFIDIEVAKLELLNSFANLFKEDSVLVLDTINVNIDSLNSRINNAQ